MKSTGFLTVCLYIIWTISTINGQKSKTEKEDSILVEGKKIGIKVSTNTDEKNLSRHENDTVIHDKNRIDFVPNDSKYPDRGSGLSPTEDGKHFDKLTPDGAKKDVSKKIECEDVILENTSGNVEVHEITNKDRIEQKIDKNVLTVLRNEENLDHKATGIDLDGKIKTKLTALPRCLNHFVQVDGICTSVTNKQEVDRELKISTERNHVSGATETDQRSVAQSKVLSNQNIESERSVDISKEDISNIQSKYVPKNAIIKAQSNSRYRSYSGDGANSEPRDHEFDYRSDSNSGMIKEQQESDVKTSSVHGGRQINKNKPSENIHSEATKTDIYLRYNKGFESKLRHANTSSENRSVNFQQGNRQTDPTSEIHTENERKPVRTGEGNTNRYLKDMENKKTGTSEDKENPSSKFKTRRNLFRLVDDDNMEDGHATTTSSVYNNFFGEQRNRENANPHSAMNMGLWEEDEGQITFHFSSFNHKSTTESSKISQTGFHSEGSGSGDFSGDDSGSGGGSWRTLKRPKSVGNIFTTGVQQADCPRELPLTRLVIHLASNYFPTCVATVLYDRYYGDSCTLTRLVQALPVSHVNALVTTESGEEVLGFRNSTVKRDVIEMGEKILDGKCPTYILFFKNIDYVGNVLNQTLSAHSWENKIIVVTASPVWFIEDFITSELTHRLVNLLVISDNHHNPRADKRKFINLYTHDLYASGDGSKIKILGAWKSHQLTRPNTNLFPLKMTNLNLYLFSVVAFHHPPFVLKKQERFKDTKWGGMEITIINLLSSFLNFTYQIYEPSDGEKWGVFLGNDKGTGLVGDMMKEERHIGIGNLYITRERLSSFDMTTPHFYDCATFIVQTSRALAKLEAIFGPFHWTVWLALTLTYILAIFLISYSDRHTFWMELKEFENLFWYVFGTFTNLFTFRHGWTQTKMASTKFLIGWYWVFSVIVTAIYTSSIIAFVTLPKFSHVANSPQDIIRMGYKWGARDRGGWEYWFKDSDDLVAQTIQEKFKFVSSLEEGLTIVRKDRYYAFLNSREYLSYTAVDNFTGLTGKSALHITRNCFVPFSVGFAVQRHSPFRIRFNQVIQRMRQAGLVDKYLRDVYWQMRQKSSNTLLVSGLKSLAAYEKKLTLEDITGTFLLLGAGLGIGFLAFFLEVFVWCIITLKRWCRQKRVHHRELEYRKSLSDLAMFKEKPIIVASSRGTSPPKTEAETAEAQESDNPTEDTGIYMDKENPRSVTAPVITVLSYDETNQEFEDRSTRPQTC